VGEDMNWKINAILFGMLCFPLLHFTISRIEPFIKRLQYYDSMRFRFLGGTIGMWIAVALLSSIIIISLYYRWRK